MITRRRRKMLVLSHVVPLKRDAGQEQRVYYTLCALQKKFDVTFATTDAAGENGNEE